MSQTGIESGPEPVINESFPLFINLSKPEEARQKQTKRTVRSHAARVSAHQHPKKQDGQSLHKPARRIKNQTYLVQVRSICDDGDVTPEERSRSISAESSSARSSEPRLLTPLTGNAGTIPATRSPVYQRPCVPLVLENYLKNLAVPMPEVDGSSEVALMRTVWFPVILHSPAIFNVIVLFSASHYAIRHPYDNDVRHATILQLKEDALRGLNTLISSTIQPSSDEVIAAAAKMASYEAIFGEEKEFHTHMQGVKNMLEQRGGLEMLGLDGLLARILLFIDTNSAHLLNSHVYLQEATLPRREPFQILNLNRFIGATADNT